MKEKFERFKNEKIVINVRSQKQYDDFMQLCEKQGLKWCGRVLPTQESNYNDYKEETCINLNNLKGLSYCDIYFYKNEGYKIITYEDFMKKSNQFTKSDLKDNHIIKARNGNKYIWFNYQMKNRFREDLRDSYWDNDIMEVWEYDKLVWKREENILDEAEKKYLSDVIRPFRKEIKNIRKGSQFGDSNYEYINILLEKDGTKLPYFKKDTMYKGMEVDKEYTLKELGLE